MFKLCSAILLLLLFFQCKQNKKENPDEKKTDSTIVLKEEYINQEHEVSNVEYLSEILSESMIFTDLFTITSFEVISEDFQDIKNQNLNNSLTIALIERGNGVYEGPLEKIFEEIKVHLVVFETTDSVTKVIDQKEIATYKNFGLETGNVFADEFDIVGNSNSISNFKSVEGLLFTLTLSYNGAGDYGYKKENSEIFVLEDGKLKSVFEAVTLNEEFTSDEIGNYATIKTESEIKILDNITNGIYDLELSIIEESSTTNDNVEEAVNEPVLSNRIFTWQNGRYQEREIY